MKGIKLLIVDFDNTLCDTFHTLSKGQWKKATAAMAKRGYAKEAKIIQNDFGKTGFVHAIQQTKLPHREKVLAFRAYQTVDVKPLKLYPDAKYLLNMKMPKVLVTRGEPHFQARKIRHLGVKKYFKEIYVVPSFRKKKISFQKILKKHKLKPSEALVIGDRIEEEIKDANELKIPCVLVRRPNWRIHSEYGTPTYTIKSLKRVIELLS
jgi:FMN phosphatase YigB (HAD superfamily)